MPVSCCKPKLRGARGPVLDVFLFLFSYSREVINTRVQATGRVLDIPRGAGDATPYQQHQIAICKWTTVSCLQTGKVI